MIFVSLSSKATKKKKNLSSTPLTLFGGAPYYLRRKKWEKILKKRFLGSMSRSYLFENGPEKVEKKYTVAHSIPDVTPRKK